MFGVKEFGIDELWGEEVGADDEDFGGDVSVHQEGRMESGGGECEMSIWY